MKSGNRLSMKEICDLWESITNKTGKTGGQVLTEFAEKILLAHKSMDKGSEDTDRLDWLEEQTKESYTGISLDYAKIAEGGRVQEKGFRFMRHHLIASRRDTLRDAIDLVRNDPFGVPGTVKGYQPKAGKMGPPPKGTEVSKVLKEALKKQNDLDEDERYEAACKEYKEAMEIYEKLTPPQRRFLRIIKPKVPSREG